MNTKEMDSSSDSDGRSSTSSLSEDELEDIIGVSNDFGVLPYQYEPDKCVSSSDSNDSSDSDEDSDVETENSRLTSSSWCKCGENCQIMDTINECVCCQEITATQNMCLNHEDEGTASEHNCITQHPGFSAVCLNKWVLQTAWYQYRQQYNNAYEGPDHKRYRHIAYRQLARWCWGWLGKEVRVILPSCAVMCIRAHFPPPGLEDNFTFEGFRYGDE